MESIEVDGVAYLVEKTYLRSVTLRPQRLLLDTPENAKACYGKKYQHPRNRFHIAVSDGTRYWIKEYIWQHSEGTVWEAEQQSRHAGMYDSGRIGAVQLVAFDATRIVMEYLDGYTSLSVFKDRDERQQIVQRVKCWLDGTGIRDYDLSENNVMVRSEVIKMIDFQYSVIANTTLQRDRIFIEMVERIPA